MSRHFYSDPPTVKGWEGSLCLYSDSRVAHCFRGLQNTAILHQEPRPRERVSPDPPPQLPPPATGWQDSALPRRLHLAAPPLPGWSPRPTCPQATWPDPLDRLAFGRERRREEARGSPAPAASRGPKVGAGLGLLVASFLLRRVFNWGAATVRSRPSPRPHTGRAPRGRARGRCPSPAGRALVRSLRRPPLPHFPLCTPKLGFRGSLRGLRPAGRECGSRTD